MARGSIRLFDGGQIERWADGFDELSRGPGIEFVDEWDDATEEAYMESQALVHIDTSFLKSSGSWEQLEGSPTTLESVVEYDASRAQLDAEQARRDAEASARAKRRGRTFTPKPNRKPLRNYGLYEHRRGDTHAWLTLAFNRMNSRFERALARGYERTVRSWR